jgi:hypothetical protein
MARFYDTVNESELQWLEGILKKGGIVYTLRVLEGDVTLLKEIMVAEEDLEEAEKLLYEKF